jgi:ectoine hydroxylase-related dioxygenase (phytanoyl-CoA dioxygenase family)
VDDLYHALASSCELPRDDAAQLDEAGFVVLTPSIAPARVEHLVAAYDAVFAQADAADVRTGSTTTRVSDFVNRGPDFDDLYVDKPILAACYQVIGQAFKLSTMHARTVHPRKPAQGLHVDFPRGEDDRVLNRWPMVGFILMIDEFRHDNGATRFVPGSHQWSEAPATVSRDYPGQISARGPAGSVIVFNGSVWHGHGPNESDEPRRSIQGAYIRRDATSGADLPARMRPETLARIGPLAKYLLAI